MTELTEQSPGADLRRELDTLMVRGFLLWTISFTCAISGMAVLAFSEQGIERENVVNTLMVLEYSFFLLAIINEIYEFLWQRKNNIHFYSSKILIAEEELAVPEQTRRKHLAAYFQASYNDSDLEDYHWLKTKLCAAEQDFAVPERDFGEKEDFIREYLAYFNREVL